MFGEVRRGSAMLSDVIRCSAMFGDVRRCSTMFGDVIRCSAILSELQFTIVTNPQNIIFLEHSQVDEELAHASRSCVSRCYVDQQIGPTLSS